MNFYLITYAISFVKVRSDSVKEDVAHVRFLDTGNFSNSNSFFSQLKQAKKIRITNVEWEIEDCFFADYYENISNTIH